MPLSRSSWRSLEITGIRTCSGTVASSAAGCIRRRPSGLPRRPSTSTPIEDKSWSAASTSLPISTRAGQEDWGGAVNQGSRGVKVCHKSLSPVLNPLPGLPGPASTASGVSQLTSPRASIFKSPRSTITPAEAPAGWPGARTAPSSKARPDEYLKKFAHAVRRSWRNG